MTAQLSMAQIDLPGGVAPPPPADPLRNRLIVVTALACPVVALSMVPALQFTYWQWISLVLAAPVVVWGAGPSHRAAWRSLRRGAASLDTLVSVGTLAALGWSVATLLLGPAGVPGVTQPLRLLTERAGATYLDVAVGVTALVVAGRYLEARSRAAELGRLGGRVAGVVVPLVIVLAVATFGFWLGTGAGPAAAFSAAAAVLLVGGPCTLGLASPTALLMSASRGTQLGVVIKGPEVLEFTRAVNTVVVDMTGTLTTGQMAVHRVVADGVGAGENGGPDAGPGGAPDVGPDVGPGGAPDGGTDVGPGGAPDSGTGVETGGGTDSGLGGGLGGGPDSGLGGGPGGDEALRMAASVEQGCDHPVGKAIVAAARERLDALPDVAEFDSSPGRGVRGVVSELSGDVIVAHAVLVGSPALLTEHGVALSATLDDAVDAARAEGLTAVAVAWDGVARATIVVGDTVTEGSADAVARLARLGLRPMLLTGGHRSAGLAVAAQVGIAADDVLADVPPEEKAAAIAALRAEGRVVAMVGDGVDDAAALAVADLGIALGTGTDADITVVRGGLPAAVDALRLGRRTLVVINGNVFWAFAYPLAALPLAASGMLSPAVALAAMALSSLFIMTNSVRLRLFRPVRRRADHAKVATGG